MATSIEHYQAAQQLLAEADKWMAGALGTNRQGAEVALAYHSALVAAAAVHADLARTAVAALASSSLGVADTYAWFCAAAVDAPIPAETDAEDGF